MPKYWGKNYFAHGSFPEVGQKQKTEKKKERKKKRERAKVGDNNGQATHGVRMAHASRLGQKRGYAVVDLAAPSCGWDGLEAGLESN